MREAYVRGRPKTSSGCPTDDIIIINNNTTCLFLPKIHLGNLNKIIYEYNYRSVQDDKFYITLVPILDSACVVGNRLHPRLTNRLLSEKFMCLVYDDDDE